MTDAITNITIQTYEDGSFDLDQFNTPEKQIFGARMLAELYRVITDNISGDIQTLNFKSDGIFIESKWEEYARSCHVDTHYETYLIPFGALFNLGEMNQYFADRREAIEMKKEAAKKAAEEAQKRAQEAADRREFKRLAEKFGALKNGE